MIHPTRTRPRRGAVLVLTAISLTVLLLILALTLDGGLLLTEKRHAQAAADAGALAGAADLFKNYSKNTGYDKDGTAKASALAIAKSNGFDPATGNATVVVRSFGEKYLGGPNAGQDIPRGNIEVTVTSFQPRYFSTIIPLEGLLIDGKIPVSARAVAAASWGIPKFGILALAPDKNGLTLGGNGIVNVTTGIIQVNSSDDSAVTNQNNATIMASELDIYGDMTGAGTIITTPEADNVNYDIPPASDPLASLPVPSEPPEGKITEYKNIDINDIAGKVTDVNLVPLIAQLADKGIIVSNVYVVEPGTYSNKTTKLANYGNGDLVIFRQASFGNGGIYYLKDGGFSSQGANLLMYPGDSGGMMFYNNGTDQADKISISGSASGVVNLSGLTDGTYQGMMIFQNRLATEPISITGNGEFNMIGTFYAPNADLNLTGNGATQTIGSALIAKTITLTGNGELKVDFSSGMVAPQRIFRLVE